MLDRKDSVGVEVLAVGIENVRRQALPIRERSQSYGGAPVAGRHMVMNRVRPHHGLPISGEYSISSD